MHTFHSLSENQTKIISTDLVKFNNENAKLKAFQELKHTKCKILLKIF